jgi:SAM-dependent methyltransferase
VFELGIGTQKVDILSSMKSDFIPGSSIRAWKEYFPNAKIFGADIDNDIIFEEERIKTYYCDQTNEEVIRNMWNNDDMKDITFDFILDDGLHTFDANMCFFKNSIHKLNNEGYFIIEDILEYELPKFVDFLPMLKDLYPELNFMLHRLIHTENNIDNNLLVVYKN